MPDRLEKAPKTKARRICAGKAKITVLKIIRIPVRRLENNRILRFSNLFKTKARINPNTALPQRLLDTMAPICAFVKCCPRMCKLKIIPYACPAKPIKKAKL